ncbi:MAG: DUF4253 domain-containing protein [Myxococcales bacterium]|nr:DUF4253 domain-containing protein [Myxococcales bacterium]
MTSASVVDTADALVALLDSAQSRVRFTELGAMLSALDEREGGEAFFTSAVASEPLATAQAILEWQRVEQLRAKGSRVSAVLVEPDAWETLRCAERPGEYTWWRDALATDSVDFTAWLNERSTREGDENASVEARVLALFEKLRAVVGDSLERDFTKLSPEQLAAWEAGDELGRDDLFALDDDDDTDHESDPSTNGVATLRLAPSPYSAGVDERAVLRSFAGRGKVHVVVLACDPWETLALLGFGAFNDCPSPALHAAAFARWHNEYGARPLLLGQATIDAIVSKPPETLRALATLVSEQLAYAPDAASDGVLALAWALFQCGGWGFWWD